MLSKITHDMDEDSVLPGGAKMDASFADLPSELMITEDNRSAIANNYRFNVATFEASKKLLYDTVDGEALNFENAPERSTLLRRIEIFEEEGKALKLVHEVVCTGFNAGAPKL